MIQIEAFLPGLDEPTDLVGFSNYLLTCFAVDAPFQAPDTLVLDFPQDGVHTEIITPG